jgi:hypothetical protein
VHAATRTVCPSGCEFTTIQAAINAAMTGDTISIAPGTYVENLAIPGMGTATQLRLQRGLGRGFFAGLPGLPSLPGILPGILPFPSAPGVPIGGEVIIDGNATRSVLRVAVGHTVDLVDLTLRNGREDGDGGGIDNDGTLRLLRVRVVDNEAEDNDGGGISNGSSGTVEATDSEVSGNRANSQGGGINNNGTMTLTTVLVRNNAARAGGGINNDGTLRLRTVQVRGNQATGAQGGGIDNSGDLQGVAVDVSGNRADGIGGGISSLGTATLTLTNSFLRGNTANVMDAPLGIGGGGLVQDSTGAVTLMNTIIEGNTAFRGGGLYLRAGSVVVQTSVVTRNTATDPGGGGGVFAEAGATLTRQLTAIVANTPNNCAGAVTC